MIVLTAWVDDEPQILLWLSHEQRQKTRLRITQGGMEYALKLPRHQKAAVGRVLRGENGERVQVAAAAEPVSELVCVHGYRLAVASYHLGNRHAVVQLGEGWLRYPQDRILDDMLLGQGFFLQHACLPFEPEPGAYHHG